MQSGVVASLSYAANNGNQLLKNFYQKGVNNINKWKQGGNYAYVISKEQRDPNMVAYLVNQLRDFKSKTRKNPCQTGNF